MATTEILFYCLYNVVDDNGNITDETAVYKKHTKIKVSKYIKGKEVNKYIELINSECINQITKWAPPWIIIKNSIAYKSMIDYIEIFFSGNENNKLICQSGLLQSTNIGTLKILNPIKIIEFTLPEDLGFKPPNNKVSINPDTTKTVDNGFYIETLTASIPITQTVNNNGGGGDGGGGGGGGDGDTSSTINREAIIGISVLVLLIISLLLIPLIYLLFTKIK